MSSARGSNREHVLIKKLSCLEGGIGRGEWIWTTGLTVPNRALKSELSIRPIFHQLERRVKAHVLVAFLGYALWVTLKHLLVRKNLKTSPAKTLSMLSGLRSADIVLPTTDRREIRLRRITTATCGCRNASILITNVVQTRR